jgi:hypothetical protein
VCTSIVIIIDIKLNQMEINMPEHIEQLKAELQKAVNERNAAWFQLEEAEIEINAVESELNFGLLKDEFSFALIKDEVLMEHTFESVAQQQGKKYEDGSGETAVWTDGLLVGCLDSRQDNLTPIKFVAGKKYRVTVKINEVEG